MASRYQRLPAAHSPELTDISDPEDEPTQREVNNRRLAQAINYLADEGGDDSPATYMHRVDRLDVTLLQRPPQQGRDFDTKLFRRLRVMVHEVQREFEETVQENSTIQENEKDLPEYYTPSAEQLLHRTDDVLEPEVRKRGGSLSHKREANENVPREREFKYGGPSNEIENWHKDFPTPLPFPETLQMAHWESLKIDFDLSEPAKQLKADSKMVETNVPFNHPAIKQYNTMQRYESGSLFKLPMASQKDQKEIMRIGSVRIVCDVTRFNKGVGLKDLSKDYAPCIFLDPLLPNIINKKSSLREIPIPTTTQIRSAVNKTPTKLRTEGLGGGNAAPGSSKIVQGTSAAKPRAQCLGGTATGGSWNILTPATRRDPSLGNAEAGPSTRKQNPQDGFEVQSDDSHDPSSVGADVGEDRDQGYSDEESFDEDLFAEAMDEERPKDPVPLQPHAGRPAAPNKPSPVAREIARLRAEAVGTSPRRQSGVTTMPPTPANSFKPPAPIPQVQVQIKKRRLAVLPQSAAAEPEPIPSSSKKASGTKRKSSFGMHNCTPDNKRKKSLGSEDYTPSSLKRAARNTPKEVRFSDDDVSDNIDVQVPKVRRNVTVKRPAQPAHRNVAAKTATAAKSVSKATAVGHQAKKGQYEESVSPEMYDKFMAEKRKEGAGEKVVKGTTRSGRTFK
ncbi:hypothetical protein EJ02DRAFT_422390 [Clathrospora elynae]|uniref:Uncharacterized protein n=1 Tax=Clathrospora elynae TaxID=706981 RepID=A0A6A5SQT2_9PLEO|nr:hypothetical protein EJ02DRAFT_422390 [Clathrospora elynae]